MAVLYETADVRADGLAAVEVDGRTWLGTYRPGPGSYFTLESNGEVSRYRPGAGGVPLTGKILRT